MLQHKQNEKATEVSLKYWVTFPPRKYKFMHILIFQHRNKPPTNQ